MKGKNNDGFRGNEVRLPLACLGSETISTKAFHTYMIENGFGEQLLQGTSGVTNTKSSAGAREAAG